MSTISASTTSTTAYKVTADTTGTLVLQTGATPTTAMTIDTSQNVGLGTSSPVQKQHLDGGAGDTYLQFSNSTTGATSSDGSRIGIASADTTLRIQNLESAAIRFDIAGSERMRIDSNGKLLVGGTTSAGGGLVQSRSTNATTVSSTYAWSNQDTGAFLWNQSDTTNSAIGLTMWGGSSGNSEAAIMMVQETANSLGALAFYTGGYGRSSTVPEAARIDSSGNLLVGSTSSNAKIFCQASSGVTLRADQQAASYSSVNIYSVFNGSSNNNTTAIHYGAYTTGVGDVMYVYGNGNIINRNNSYGSFSDIKLKENITDATPKLTGLMQVRVVNYNLIGETNKQLGVVAQELEQIFPSMVEESADYENITTTDEDGNEKTERVLTGTTTKQVKYSVFVPMLIKAIQEQQDIIETLTNRITALEAK